MTLGLWAFGPFDTTFLPAAGLWTSASGVTIVAGGGRSGSADDNCAAFDTALGSVLSRTVTPAAVGGIYTATYGLAVRVLTVSASGDLNNPSVTTLASIWTATSKIDFLLLETGALRLTQTVGGVLIGTIAQTVANVVPIATGGIYLEARVRFEAGVVSACQVWAADQSGQMNALVQGALLVSDGGPYTTFRLGGGVGELPATWQATDVYLNDGVPAATPIAYKGRLIYNDAFFGNTHVEAYYPTADGTNLSTGNTPWVPDTGSVQYTQINEHPPDEDDSYVSADTSEQTSTFSFQSPHARPFGRLNCSAEAPIYALQWDGRMRSTGPAGTVVPILRQIVSGTIAGDQVAEGAEQEVADTDYLYYPAVWDRNPIDDSPWDFAMFFPSAVGAVGTTELGMRLL